MCVYIFRCHECFFVVVVVVVRELDIRIAVSGALETLRRYTLLCNVCEMCLAQQNIGFSKVCDI